MCFLVSSLVWLLFVRVLFLIGSPIAGGVCMCVGVFSLPALFIFYACLLFGGCWCCVDVVLMFVSLLVDVLVVCGLVSCLNGCSCGSCACFVLLCR